MHLLELVRITTAWLTSMLQRLTLFKCHQGVSQKFWSCTKICCGREDSKICTAFGPLSGRGWLWNTVHVGLFLCFNDSYSGPYSCLSFNAKHKLLFSSNCCFGNRSRHQVYLWILQLCIFQSEVPSLGYCWHLAVAVLYQLLVLPLPHYLCIHSCGI